MSMVDILVKKLQLSPNRERVVRNLFWSVLGKVVTLLGSLFVGIVIARYLGPEQYGLMNYVISYVSLFQVFALFGLDSIEVREEARGDVPPATVMGTAFAIKLGLAFFTLGLCVLTSWLMEEEGYVTLLVFIYSLTILVQTFGVTRNYFMAMVQNEYVVKAEISRTLLGAALKIGLLCLDVSLTAFVIASAFDVVLLMGGYVMAYRRHVGPLCVWRFSMPVARHLLRESFPLLLTNAAVIVYQRVDQVMIGQLIDKTHVGYFTTATRFVEILIFIPMMLAQTISPILVEVRKQSEVAYRQRAQQFMNVSVWMSFLASALLSLLAYWVVLFTFGRDYLPAVAVLQLLAFKTASVALSNTAGSMLVVEGLQRWAFFRDSLGCLACIGLNWWLLPRYGILAAAGVAIAVNVVAGYLSDALIPAYRHLFVAQTRALFCGWRDLVHIRAIIKGGGVAV